MLHRANEGGWHVNTSAPPWTDHSPGATPARVSGCSYDVSGGQVGHRSLVVMMGQEHLHTWEARESPSRVVWGCFSQAQRTLGYVLGVWEGFNLVTEPRTFPLWDDFALLINHWALMGLRFGTNGFTLKIQPFQANQSYTIWRTSRCT